MKGLRTVAKEGYQDYIRSREWQAVKMRYWESKLPKACYGCGVSKEGMHLHHRTYKNLGQERLRDLVPLCQLCHCETHDLVRNGRSLWGAARRIRRTNGLHGQPV